VGTWGDLGNPLTVEEHSIVICHHVQKCFIFGNQHSYTPVDHLTINSGCVLMAGVIEKIYFETMLGRE
jgi:hypothetical protein